jgi:hypothetical protein
LGDLRHRLSSKKDREGFETEVGRVEQVEIALSCAEQLPSGRSSAPCAAATQTSSLELRGFLQLNKRQMPTTGQMRHD